MERSFRFPSNEVWNKNIVHFFLYAIGRYVFTVHDKSFEQNLSFAKLIPYLRISIAVRIEGKEKPMVSKHVESNVEDF